MIGASDLVIAFTCGALVGMTAVIGVAVLFCR